MKRYISNLILFSIWVFLALGIWEYQPLPSILTLDLSTQSGEPHRVNAFFYENGERPAYKSTDERAGLEKPQRYYLPYPKTYRADGAVVDLGTTPADWEVTSVAAHANFFLFSVPSYTWPKSVWPDVANRTFPSVTVESDQSIQVADQVRAPRVRLDLDFALTEETLEQRLFKLAVIVLILFLLLLVASGRLCSILNSGYLLALFTKRKDDLQALHSDYRENWRVNQMWIWAGIAAACIVLLFKTSPYWAYPGFHFEDGMEFSDYVSGRVNLFDIESYRYYRGYFVFVSELFVAFAAIFPTTWQPHLYLAIGSGFMLLSMCMLATTGIFTQRAILLIAPTVLYFGAFTNQSLYLTLTSTLFSATVLVMALVLRPLPGRRLLMSVVFVLTSALTWSGPYGAQLLIYASALLILFGSGRQLALFAFLFCASLAYVVSAQDGMLRLEYLLNPHITVAFFNGLVEYIFFLNLLGTQDYKVGLLVISLIVLSIYLLRKDRVFVKAALIFLVTGLGAFLTYFVSAKYYQYQGSLSSAHVVVSQLCWLVFLLLVSDRLLKRANNVGTARALSAILIVAFATMLVARDHRMHSLLTLKPDPKLHRFLVAVDSVREMSIPENHFVQIWHRNDLQFTSSFVRRTSENEGSENEGSENAALTFSRDELPNPVKEFFINADFKRKLNTTLEIELENKRMREFSTMVDYDWRPINFAQDANSLTLDKSGNASY
ncbi:MAG: hypothetical protein AAF197_02090 [Pseudomonadota bacterium]